VQNYVDPGDANFVKIKTTNVAFADGSYEQSITTFTIKNKAHGLSKHTESVKSVTIEDPPAVVSGNVALISIDAVAQERIRSWMFRQRRSRSKIGYQNHQWR
jgi:hypothetical protein